MLLLVVLVWGVFFLDHNKYSWWLSVMLVKRLQSAHGGCWLLEDAAPRYCRHHHSASVPLCCLLPVSLTAVSQASAYRGKPHRPSLLTVQLAKVMFTISICWSPVIVTTCRSSFTWLLVGLNYRLAHWSGCDSVYRLKWHRRYAEVAEKVAAFP